MSRGTLTAANHFELAAAIATAEPLTIAAWLYPTSLATTIYGPCIFYTAGTGTSVTGFELLVTTAGLIRARKEDAGTGSQSATSSALAINGWYHIGGVFTAANSRTAFLNGGAATANSTNIVFTNTPDKTSLGVLYRHDNSMSTNRSDAYWAEIGFWNIALTAADMLVLAAGYSPLMVKPEALLAYYPMVRGDANGDAPDLVGGLTMVEQGTVDVQPHARVFYRGHQNISHKAPAAGGLVGSPFYRLLQGVD
jgi:hypothetical protein